MNDDHWGMTKNLEDPDGFNDMPDTYLVWRYLGGRNAGRSKALKERSAEHVRSLVLGSQARSTAFDPPSQGALRAQELLDDAIQHLALSTGKPAVRFVVDDEHTRVGCCNFRFETGEILVHSKVIDDLGGDVSEYKGIEVVR